ncbi:MAG: hypothetical protein IH585_18735 [Anaerolineaceae bacterium]|nr:hypothetical protein [Anaerolineaceae bacterium]
MFKLAIEVAELGVDIHKWAALKKTQVFPVRPIFSLAIVRGLVFIIFVILALVYFIVM